MSETGAEVIGLDWRVPLDEGWRTVGHKHAVQGNLDPVTLFASWNEVKQRAEHILRLADGRPGHIFNLGHGILPQTPVDNVKNLAEFVHEFSTSANGGEDSNEQDRSSADRARQPRAGRGHSRVPAEHLARASHARGGGARGAASLFADRQLAADADHARSRRRTWPASWACRCMLGCATGIRSSPTRCKQMASDNVGQAVAVCLAPHNSRTSVGRISRRCSGRSARSPSISWRSGTTIRC